MADDPQTLAEMLADAGETPRSTRYPISWRTQDGRLMHIEEMSDSHLINTVYFLRRNAAGKKEAQVNSLRPVNPTAAARLEERPLRDWFPEWHPQYRYLVEELHRRNVRLSPNRDWNDGVRTNRSKSKKKRKKEKGQEPSHNVTDIHHPSKRKIKL